MIGVMPAELSFAEKPTITGERERCRRALVEPADAAGLAAIDDEALLLTGTQGKASRKSSGAGTPAGPGQHRSSGPVHHRPGQRPAGG